MTLQINRPLFLLKQKRCETRKLSKKNQFANCNKNVVNLGNESNKNIYWYHS